VRLYLSSFRLGHRPEQLLRLIDRSGPVAVLAHAMDGAPPERRRAAVQLEIDALATIGLTAVELDLRLGDPSRVTERLAAFAALWLRGGNAFVLRAGLAATGADAAIVELLRGDQLVYAGYSAGPCVAGPTLRGLEAVDDVSEVRPTYGCEPVWDGLGLLDRPLVPHVESPGHPETADCTRLSRGWDEAGVSHWALRDGQALVVDGDDVRLV
jgi:dipeptidase E